MYIYNINSRLSFKKPITIQMADLTVTQVLQDGAIGVPLNLFSNIYTNIHYGYDITTINSVLLQFLLGFYTYTNDRYKDALEYKENKSIINYSTSKINTYNKILNNKNIYDIILPSSVIGILYLMIINNYDPSHFSFFPLLYLASEYKEYKPLLYIYKPAFIAAMWTITTVILPCVIYDNNFSILNDPQSYMASFFLIYSASNFADIDDIEEDTINGIQTLPVVFGKKITGLSSFITITIATLLLLESHNFENRFIFNTLTEVQQLGLMYYYYNNTFN